MIIELTNVVSMMPNSPFRPYIDSFFNDASMREYLGYINYFIPVKDILVVFGAYCGAIILYYLYSIILRIARVIR